MLGIGSAEVILIERLVQDTTHNFLFFLTLDPSAVASGSSENGKSLRNLKPGGSSGWLAGWDNLPAGNGLWQMEYKMQQLIGT